MNSMTKVNEIKEKKAGGLKKRLDRRSLLKAGAIAAPVALTLHGGVPLAHADSAGLCVVQLMDIAKNSSDHRSDMLQVPMKDGAIARPNMGSHKTEIKAEDYPQGTTIEPFNASPQHWEFLSDPRNQRYGFSCVSSIGYKKFTKISDRV